VSQFWQQVRLTISRQTEPYVAAGFARWSMRHWTINQWHWRAMTWWLRVTRRCPQCAVKRPYHKMDCSRRYDHLAR